MIRLIELFAGYGSQAMALERLQIPFEHYKVVEFDKYAINSYNAVHGTDFETTDIKDVLDLEIVDTERFTYLLTYSFPCCTGETLVLTEKGYKYIRDIQVGDMVLTHRNRYRKVLNVFNNGDKKVFSVIGMSFHEMKFTENHKFYTRERYAEWDNPNRTYIRKFKEPKWVELKNLTKDNYLGIPVNNNSKLPKWEGLTINWNGKNRIENKNYLSTIFNKKEFWWIMGRYIADGWYTNSGIKMAIGKEKLGDLKEMGDVFHFTINEERTVYKVTISSVELMEYVKQFGKGAENKRLTSDILNLPVDLLESFVNGYMSGDGCFTNGKYKCTSVSEKLIYGLGQCVSKVYKRPFAIYKSKRKETCIIEDRVVNQKPSYSLEFKKVANKQDKAFYENGYVWFPFKECKYLKMEEVFDIEVEEDHSFTAFNTIVHNCTDLSLAGKRQGMKKGSGTRSGLLWEVERILKNSKELPQIMLMENVPEVIGKDNEQDFNEWKAFLESLGYKNQVQIINAKDVNIPQNRKRCFMISTIGYDNYIMPTSDYLKDKYKNKEKLVVQQLLELNVEEKYYVNTEYASTLTTRYYKGIGANGDNIVCVGNINPSGNGLNGNVYSGNIIPTLTTNKGEGPKILTQTICASRGRNKENPNDRTPGAELEQRIEINQEDMSNTLTTVQKDNMVLQQILFKSRSDEPFRTFENGTCGTLRTIDSCGDKRVLVKQATQQGFIGCEVGGVADLSYPDSNTRRGRVIDNGNTSPTLTCNDSSVYKIETEYRIRKLTPRECGRLMDVSEEDISKMIEVNSNTQLYKQFGNSIVVKVLEELFISLFVENHMDTYIPLGRDGIDGQMSVFDL